MNINPSSLSVASLPCVEIANKRMLPPLSGIYFAYTPEPQILYIGSAINLKKRWVYHHRHEMLSEFPDVKIAYLLIPEIAELKHIEEELIQFFRPPVNNIPGVIKPEPMHHFHLILHKDEFRALQIEANAAGLTVANYIRQMLGFALHRQGNRHDLAPKPVPIPKQ